MREFDIKNELERVLPYTFDMRLRGGATTTEFVEELQKRRERYEIPQRMNS